MLTIAVLLYLSTGAVMADVMRTHAKVPLVFSLIICLPLWPIVMFFRILYYVVYKIMGVI